jgi:hypothetical protein
MDTKRTLTELYTALRGWLAAGEKVIIHQEELGDRLMGIIGGYLLATRLIDTGPHAVTVVEQILHRQMGPLGRELVAIAGDL